MKETKLKKEISGLTALTVVVGTVIGAGVFFKPTAVFGASGGAGLGMLAWLVGGVIAICGGLTVAEIGTLIPETGGMMVFLEKIFGKPLGFLVGWAQLVVYFPANIAALSIIFGTQAVNLLGLTQFWIVPVSITAIIIITIINGIGNKATGALQTTATFMKIIPLVVLIIAGLWLNKDPLTVTLFPLSQGSRSFASSFGASLVATLFAYDGWMNVSALSGEMKNPSRDLPRAIVGGLSIVIALYLMINMAYLNVMTAQELANTVTPAADVATLLFPGFGSKLVTVGILISVFGGINGYSMAAWRVPYALGLKNMLPKSQWLAKLHPKTNMPINGGLVLLVIIIGMILSGSFDQLTDLSVFVIWMFNTLTFVGVFVLRKRQPDTVRSYKVPLYPFVPLVAIVGGGFIVINTLFEQPLNATLGLVLTVLGLPLYYWHEKTKL
ncbi:amino acid permease [Vagococcus sp. BWB3-3]|uniref:Amino acid permease n=1 Tax=Vagococcus allomyrinae TaxID=2794353 RepID=A0A940PFF3_9ENTE|nr:amino acid permease [Vagococcus allomyrinae]MBP1041843.1 amino acid permease [Vagococcus allomyrinae]